MQNKQMNTVLFWFGILMAAVFICCGFSFLFTNFLLANVPKPNRTYLGYVFIVYGAFRATRQYSRYKNCKQMKTILSKIIFPVFCLTIFSCSQPAETKKEEIIDTPTSGKLKILCEEGFTLPMQREIY